MRDDVREALQELEPRRWPAKELGFVLGLIGLVFIVAKFGVLGVLGLAAALGIAWLVMD